MITTEENFEEGERLESEMILQRLERLEDRVNGLEAKKIKEL